MVLIIPAVLPKNFKELEKQLSLVRPQQDSATLAQIDVVDGHFAPNRTWPYGDEAAFANIVKEEKGLPFWGEFDFQFDLMIEHPENRVMEFVHAGAAQIIVHARSAGAEEAFKKLVDLRGEGDFSVKGGIALPINAQLEELEPFDAQFDFVQIMGIRRIGYQGEAFDTHAIYLIERLRHRYPDLVIQVDGGVTMANAQALAKAGANRLVVGSAIFKAIDPVRAILELGTEANRN